MSRKREDYEKRWWRRLQRFVDGERVEKKEHVDIFSENTSFLNNEGKRDTTKVELEWEKPVQPSREALYRRYQQWPQTKGVQWFRKIYNCIAVIFCLVLITVLLLTVNQLPTFGAANNPTSNEVVSRYISDGLEETGATNIVAGMILDYRAFDTLGESHVLFIAATCVMILLRLDSKSSRNQEIRRKPEKTEDPILRMAAKILTPFILIFGIYIILNGHLSPGGGFSGGAIIGAGLILMANAFGFDQTGRFFTRKTYSIVTVSALLFYSAAKSYSFFTGANHLESGIPKGIPGAIVSGGLILPLNICVGLVVACTMYGFYSLFRKGEIG